LNSLQRRQRLARIVLFFKFPTQRGLTKIRFVALQLGEFVLLVLLLLSEFVVLIVTKLLPLDAV
jgi:hypothetical protein